MSQDLQELWAQCLLNIERRVRPQSFKSWFRPTKVWTFSEENLVIECPTSYSAEWVESNYLNLIQEVVQEETHFEPKITFAVADENQARTSVYYPPDKISSAPFSQSSHLNPGSKTHRENPRAEETYSRGTHMPLNERYTFETFVVGEFNRFAHAAACAVAKSPGKTQFNPLVIYGGVGLGKTHLLQAIGHHVLQGTTKRQVTYVPSEKFLSDFIEAIKNRTTAEFQRLYRSADILLVDDIQFLLKGEQTRKEFFHTFNALHQNGKQIAMTCDSPPRQLEGLEERLISRFQWGLVTNIDPPDLETRIAILKQKSEINNIYLPENVAVFLGNNINSNIRELEGALIHLMAYCSVNQCEPTVETAQHIVQERIPTKKSPLNIGIIQEQVAEYFDLSSEFLISRTRKQNVALARQIAMFLAKRLTPNSLKTIGLQFGNRDHTTVIHAVQSIEEKCKKDTSVASVVKELTNSIQRKNAQA